MRKSIYFISLVLSCIAFAHTSTAQETQMAKEKEADMQKNPVVFWELASNDAEKSVEFLKKAFDWDMEFDEKIGIYVVPAGESSHGIDGGIFTLRKAKLPFLTIYIRVDDIESKAKLVEQLGGHIVEQPVEIPGGSRICLFNEPSGVTFAMIEKPSSK